MTVSPLLRLAIGTGLAVVGLAFLGNALWPLQEQAVLPAASDYGSLPPRPESPASDESADGEIERAEVHLPVRDALLGGIVLAPAEPDRYPASSLSKAPGRGAGRA